MDKIQEATKLLLEHDSEKHTKKSPLVTLEGWGNSSKLKILGIDVSKAVQSVAYYGHGSRNNKIAVEVDPQELIEVISRISVEDMKKAREIIQPYINDKFE